MVPRRWIAGLTAVLTAALAGCGATVQAQPEPVPAGREPVLAQPDQPPTAPAENYGRAPEITNDVWLNADEPIRIADQRGKVVLVEFWTFG